MDKIRSAFAEHWQLLLAAVASVVAFCFLLTFRLGVLTHRRLNPAELASHNSALSWHAFLHNPMNAPYKLFDTFIVHIYPHSAPFARVASVLFALLACGLFFIIMYRWHGRRTAILTTMLFGTSSWLLHIGRLGIGDSTFLAIPLALVLFASWLNSTKRHGMALLYMTLASGVALFTPGAVWFLLATYLLLLKPIAKHLAHAKLWEKSVCIIAMLYFVVMLIFVLLHTPHLYKIWLDLPPSWPAPLTLVKQWLDSAAFLFVRGPTNPSLWLAHTPILDIFTSAMCLIGAYFYITHYKNLRTHVLVTFLAIGSLLVAINGAAAMSFVVPIIYLLIGTGLTYFLRQWLAVFPRNPLARGLGIGLICIIVVAACLYHIDRYFVAWRYNPATVAAFHEQP